MINESTATSQTARGPWLPARNGRTLWTMTPTIFIPHGAGPCFFMDWEPAGTWDRMAGFLRTSISSLDERPAAIVLVSAHWEEQRFTVGNASAPGLLFDYFGFPPHTYALTWPAPGDPELAAAVRALIADAGFETGTDDRRGLDHGVFIPLKVALPEANIPVVPLSLRSGLDPEEHLAVGRALAPLRERNVLLIGSGMSFHNMSTLRRGGTHVDPDSERFDQWLAETVSLPRDARESRLAQWSNAPGARESHPREEHLLPLHVIAGAAGDSVGTRVFRDDVLGSAQSAYRFG